MLSGKWGTKRIKKRMRAGGQSRGPATTRTASILGLYPPRVLTSAEPTSVAVTFPSARRLVNRGCRLHCTTLTVELKIKYQLHPIPATPIPFVKAHFHPPHLQVTSVSASTSLTAMSIPSAFLHSHPCSLITFSAAETWIV